MPKTTTPPISVGIEGDDGDGICEINPGIPQPLTSNDSLHLRSEDLSEKYRDNGRHEDSAPKNEPIVNPFIGAFLTLSALYQYPDPDNWLVRDLFCRGDMVMVYGDSGSGKTFVVVDLLMCLATGQPWCKGQFDVPAPRQVVYCTGEGKRGIRKRFHARHMLYQEHGGEDSPRVIVLPKSPQLFNREAPDSVDNFVRAYRENQLPEADVIVIDTLNRASLGGDENSTKDATLMIAGAEYIRDQFGTAVIIVHHTNKAGLYRGNTALRGSMDIMLEVRKSSQGNHILHCDKIKDGDEFPDLAFHFNNYEDSSVIEWDGKALTRIGSLSDSINRILLESPGKHFSASQIAALTDSTPANVARCLREVLAGRYESGLLVPTQEPNKRRNPKVYWAKESATCLPYKEDSERIESL